MARTAEGALLTRQHRELQATVRAATLRDLLVLWRTVDPLNLSGTIAPFTGAAAVTVAGRRRQSALAASRYATAFRQVEGVDGTLALVLPPPLATDYVQGTVRGAALTGIMNARRSGFSVDAATRAGFVKVSGSATRLVLGGGRDVLLETVRADRAAQGYQRITSANDCAFCEMLASRGPVYKSEDSGGFAAHDHCACSLEPVYE